MNVFNLPSVITNTLAQVAGTLASKLSAGQQAVELARSVVGQKAHDLKLANHTPIGKVMRDDVPDVTNCANFVSAVLVVAGQIPESAAHAHVTHLANNLTKAGWQEVPLKDAQPGDVVVLQYRGQDAHVELATGFDDKGHLKMIGSNNRSDLHNAQVISENTLTNYWSGVKVLHNPNAKASGVTSNAAVAKRPAPPAHASPSPASSSGFDTAAKKKVSLGRTQTRPAVTRRPAEAPPPSSELDKEVARMRTGGGVLGAVAKAVRPAAAPTASQTTRGPAPKLAEATVTSKESTEFGPTPWEFNKWIPVNGGRESQKFREWHQLRDAAVSLTKGTHELEKATRAQAAAQAAVKAAGTDPKKLKVAQAHLDAAGKAVDLARTHVDTAQASVDATSAKFKKYLLSQLPQIEARDPQVVALTAHKHALEKAVVEEKKKKHPDAAKLARLHADIDTAKVDIAARKEVAGKIATQQIGDYQPIQSFERTSYEVQLGGQKVTLTDAAQTYATENKQGLSAHANDGGQKGVDAAVDASGFSDADKLIMKQISRQEGHFSTTESYDVGGVTWGMLQWTTGHDGKGSVIKVLEKIKTDSPEAFRNRFQDYGIDVSHGTLTVTRPDGTVLSGAAAVEAVRTEPKLSAAFAVAGTDADVQAAQLALAKTQKIDQDGLNRPADVTVGGKHYRFTARQIFTSAWGAALVANAGVHAGPGRVQQRLKAGLETFFAANPGLDLAHPEKWAAQAEKAIADVMIAGDGPRAKAFLAAGLSQAPGSYASAPS